jgi:endonuclease G
MGARVRVLLAIPLLLAAKSILAVPQGRELLPSGEGIAIRHAYYALDYNVHHKQANWVYHRLTGSEGRVSRSNNFRADPLLGALSATPADYARSGYDRGHLCPAADMAFDKTAMSETFYMSNISPQLAAFNRGIWKKIEESVRQRLQDGDTLHVVTGPLFRDNKGSIGASRVTVPGAFYKICYSPARRQMIAYVVPNERSEQPVEHHVVPVDSVEKWTGIDFFPGLPDELEQLLEADTLAHDASPPAGEEQQEIIILLLIIIVLVFALFWWSARRRR